MSNFHRSNSLSVAANLSCCSIFLSYRYVSTTLREIWDKDPRCLPRIIQPIRMRLASQRDWQTYQRSSTSAPEKYLRSQAHISLPPICYLWIYTNRVSAGTSASLGFFLLWTTKMANLVAARRGSRSASGCLKSSSWTSFWSSRRAYLHRAEKNMSWR